MITHPVIVRLVNIITGILHKCNCKAQVQTTYSQQPLSPIHLRISLTLYLQENKTTISHFLTLSTVSLIKHLLRSTPLLSMDGNIRYVLTLCLKSNYWHIVNYPAKLIQVENHRVVGCWMLLQIALCSLTFCIFHANILWQNHAEFCHKLKPCIIHKTNIIW